MPSGRGTLRATSCRVSTDALRAADGALLTTDAIAGRVIEAKCFDAADAALRKAIGEQALAILRSFRKLGSVEQIGLGRGVRWKLKPTGGFSHDGPRLFYPRVPRGYRRQRGC